MWMSVENVVLGEGSQTQKHKYCAVPLTRGPQGITLSETEQGGSGSDRAGRRLSGEAKVLEVVVVVVVVATAAQQRAWRHGG